MSDNTHKSVVRNEGYTRGAVSHIERHNERKNENYSNIDVVLEQSHNNLYYKTCDSSYIGEFDRMVDNGEISTRGLKLNSDGKKAESNIVAEMIFDVNTEYFETHYEQHGYANSYDFAKNFYYDAYKMAVAEVGDEKYILSAIMHADERNKGLSEALGRDIYHYHLHVVYIPVVQKEILWTKRCKDPALVGTVKEVITQVNHSKKWESEKVTDDNGKEHLIYSYSKLQDRYHDHMTAAGYRGFERGKQGSTSQHLSVLEYKAKIREQELAEKEKAIAEAEIALAEKSEKLVAVDEDLTAAEKQLIQTENKIDKLSDEEKNIKGRIKSIEDSGQMLTLKQIEKIATKIHAPLVGYRGVILSEQDEKNLRATAMASAKLSEKNKMLTNALNAAYKTIKEIIQSVLLLKYRFTEPNTPPCENLSEPQQTLIDAIRNFGKNFFKSYGRDSLADELSKARLDGDISKNYSELADERERKNKKSQPSFSEILEANRVKAKEHNAQNSSSRTTQTNRKISGDER